MRFRLLKVWGGWGGERRRDKECRWHKRGEEEEMIRQIRRRAKWLCHSSHLSQFKEQKLNQGWSIFKPGRATSVRSGTRQLHQCQKTFSFFTYAAVYVYTAKKPPYAPHCGSDASSSGLFLFLDPDDIPVAEVGEINASIRSSLALYKSPEDVTLKENFLNGV